jgi:hypothetical protein
MKRFRRAASGWQLADLLDFEILLASDKSPAGTRDRTVFVRDIRPQLADLPEARRRRVGLWLWLDNRRAEDGSWPGAACMRTLAWLRQLLFIGMFVSGALLATGLCLGSGQRVHVVVFFALTVLLPWAVFLLLLVGRRLWRRSQAGIGLALNLLLKLVPGDRGVRQRQQQAWIRALSDSRAAASALGARLSGLLQWGGLGFGLGVVLAFVATLMIFDVRFYWESTPDNDVFMRAAVQTVSWPWAGVWPAAVPNETVIAASRLRSGAAAQRLPGGHIAGAWWRFLLMSVLVWSVLPRWLLAGVFAWQERRALRRLDFQAPRHRSLWRQLAGVERGQTVDAAGDGALVLDVGGSGLDGIAIRGFMLRRLRLNPLATQRVSVLDDGAEAAADKALAAAPPHVVLVALDWALSPRQTVDLQQRVRRIAGEATPVTWVVAGGTADRPACPGAEEMQRWTAFIDGLADPATEIAAYDPAA